MERNIDTDNSILSVGAGGPGQSTVKLDVRNRAAHLTSSPHLHTKLVSGEVVTGSPGFTGSFTIPGTGWARVSLRVKGVACAIPIQNYSATETDQHDQRMGALMKIGGSGIYSENRIQVSIGPLPDAPYGVFEFPLILTGELALNLSESEEEYSDVPIVFDRVVSFSALRPFTASTLRPIGWTEFGLPSEGHGLHTGGTADADAPFSQSNYGFPIFGVVCANPGLNCSGLLPPYDPIFTDPTNIVNLLVQLAGWRPDDGPKRETYHDLA